MKPLSTLAATDLAQIKILSFDSDGVTVERGTEILEQDGTLSIKTKTISSELLDKITKLKKHFHINVTSGRSLLHLARIYGPVLWEKASLQGENGLFTLFDGQVLQTEKLSSAELEKIVEIKEAITNLAKTNQNIKGFEPKQFLISVHCNAQDESLVNLVRELDPKGDFYLYWNSGEAYDIFPKRFGKDKGLEFLVKYLGFNLSQVLAVGNDPNDREIVGQVGISVTTNPEGLSAGFYTEEKQELGGEEVIDRILKLKNE